MDISLHISLFLHFILGIFCIQQKLDRDLKYDLLGLLDNFYNTKMESLYQCMELCLQFTACKGVSYLYLRCYLHNDGHYEMIHKCRADLMHWRKAQFPDHISGACLNHKCSIDTRCLALTGTSKHVCVPHGLPTFTCPLFWFRHHKSCYQAFFVNATWQSAYDQCKLQDASLIEIHDKDTQVYMITLLTHFGNIRSRESPGRAVFVPGGQLYWTALNDNETDGEWVWRGSGKVLAGFTYWTANATWEKLVPGNDCVGMSIPNWMGWEPAKCESVSFYVCEKLMVK